MTMNRAQRRNLQRVARHAMKSRAGLAHPVPGDSVLLHGGPMKGWVVTADAPALDPAWHDGLLESMAAGMYERDRARLAANGEQLPPWADITAKAREPYLAAALVREPAGRYQLDKGGRSATWVLT